MKRRDIIQTLWALAILGQIIFYILSFSRVIGHVQGDPDTMSQAIGSLMGIDFLAVASTSVSWSPEMYFKGEPIAGGFRIFIYILTGIIVFGVMLDNILGWIR